LARRGRERLVRACLGSVRYGLVRRSMNDLQVYGSDRPGLVRSGQVGRSPARCPMGNSTRSVLAWRGRARYGVDGYGRSRCPMGSLVAGRGRVGLGPDGCVTVLYEQTLRGMARRVWVR
jgi:hypothetical protein